MNATDNTARRERAEEWAKNLLAKMKAEDWGWRSEEAPLSFGYLAGAREEAAEKDKEIARLQAQVATFSRQNDEDRSGFFAGMKKYEAEIAALREAIKWRWTTTTGTNNLSDETMAYVLRILGDRT